MRRGVGEERRRRTACWPRSREEDGGLIGGYGRGEKRTLNFGFGERGMHWGCGIIGERGDEFDDGIHAFVLCIDVCIFPGCCKKSMKVTLRSFIEITNP